MSGDTITIVQELHKLEFRTHLLVVYHDLVTFREMYSHYAKAALIDNEIVVILPFYETVDSVRRILSEDSANIDVRKFEKEQSLLIIDSLKSYFGSQDGLIPFVNRIVQFAKDSGRNGVSVIGDMGPFFYFGKNAGLLYYETTLPIKFEEMDLKGLCAYHKQDFDKKLSEKEKRILIEHHGETLYLSQFS